MGKYKCGLFALCISSALVACSESGQTNDSAANDVDEQTISEGNDDVIDTEPVVVIGDM